MSWDFNLGPDDRDVLDSTLLDTRYHFYSNYIINAFSDYILIAYIAF